MVDTTAAGNVQNKLQTDAIKQSMKADALLERQALTKQGKAAEEYLEKRVLRKATEKEAVIGDRASVRLQAIDDTVNQHMPFTFDPSKPFNENIGRLGGAVDDGYKKAWGKIKDDFDPAELNAVSKEMKNLEKLVGSDDAKKLLTVQGEIKKLGQGGADLGVKAKALDREIRKRVYKAEDSNTKDILEKAREALRSQLGPDGKKILADMDEAYPKYLAIRNASRSAMGKRGEFTPAQLEAGIKSTVGRQRGGGGEAPHQMLLASQNEAETSAIKALKTAQDVAGRKKKGLTKAVTERSQAMERGQKIRFDAIPDAEKLPVKKAFEGYEKALDQSKFLERLKNNEPSLYYNMLAWKTGKNIGQIGLLGAGIGGAATGSLLPMAAAGAAGLGGIHALGTKAGQKALAGQYGWQEKLREAATKGYGTAASSALRRGAIFPNVND